MEINPERIASLAKLRVRAEEAALSSREKIEQEYALLPREEAIRLVHELYVHQIELRMQNDELRKIQDALEISRTKYFDLYDRAPIGYCTLDNNGNFLEANSAAAELLELPPSALNRQPFERFVAREFQDTWYLLRKRLQAAALARDAGIERHEIIELQMVGKKGTTVWVRLNAKVTAENDAQVLMRIMMSDISLLKQAETENARLEKMRFEQQKLEALGSLAAGVAHDFNNLLAALFGNIELAQMTITDKAALEFLTQAMASLDTARGLTRQLLTFSKGGGPNLKPDHLFAFVREIFERSAKASNITCNFDIAHDDALIPFDPQQMRQVVEHLLQNAREAMRQGGTLRLSAKNITLRENERGKLPAGNYALVSIADSGTGIPQPMLHQVFDPFFTTKVGHHGLGLTTCYSILKRHKGTIEVESFTGKGTVLHFLLPGNG